jgi:NADH-quinone oxidoreductase subunit L
VFLALASLFPLFSLNPFIYEHAWLYSGLTPSNFLERVNIYHTIIPIGVNILSLFVIYSGYDIYVKRNTWSFPQTGFLYRLSYNQWYIDAIYMRFIVAPFMAISRGAFSFDRKVIDGFVNFLPNVVVFVSKIAAWFDYYIIDGVSRLLTFMVESIGNIVRRFQRGKIQYYLFSMLAIVLALFILKILI